MDVDPTVHSCPDVYVPRAAHPTQSVQLLLEYFRRKATDKDLRIVTNVIRLEV